MLPAHKAPSPTPGRPAPSAPAILDASARERLSRALRGNNNLSLILADLNSLAWAYSADPSSEEHRRVRGRARKAQEIARQEARRGKKAVEVLLRVLDGEVGERLEAIRLGSLGTLVQVLTHDVEEEEAVALGRVLDLDGLRRGLAHLDCYLMASALTADQSRGPKGKNRHAVCWRVATVLARYGVPLRKTKRSGILHRVLVVLWPFLFGEDPRSRDTIHRYAMEAIDWLADLGCSNSSPPPQK